MPTPPFCPPSLPRPVTPFKPGFCCLVMRGDDGQVRYCGAPAAGVRESAGFLSHEGSSCYRCAPHKTDEEARGIRFDPWPVVKIV